MLVRIVKMGFEDDKIDDFIAIFEHAKEKIRSFDGCEFLELYQDKNDSSVFFTYSYWRDEAALDSYRNSKLFENTWKKTKKLFNQKPQAWSVDKLHSLA